MGCSLFTLPIVLFLPDDFVNFNTLALYDEGYSFIVALVVFFATIKLLKLLQFNRRMGMLGATVKLAAKDLKGFTFMFTIYIFAFIQLGVIIFGKVFGALNFFCILCLKIIWSG